MTPNYASFAALERTVLDTGLWDDGRRTGPHRFRLSPQNYLITPAQRVDLDAIAQALYRVLAGMNRLMAISGDSTLHRSGDAYSQLGRVLGHGSPYHSLSGLRAKSMPVLCKTDFVVGEDGKPWIAEADATNPRSWGNSTVRRLLAEVIQPNANRLQGVIPYLAQQLARRKISDIVFLYGDAQRFYAPEFGVVKKYLAEYGVGVTVINETEVDVTANCLNDARTGMALPQAFVDLPVMSRNGKLVKWLTTAARERRVDFLIPPKHFLSSKAMLAVIGNVDADASIEGLLCTQIEPRDLQLVRKHLPPTHIIRADQPDTVARLLKGGRYILKKSFASGTKGVWFQDDPRFERALSSALQNQDGYYVLQREIYQQPHRWAVYPEHGLGEVEETDGWYLRLTGYVAREGMAELSVTARNGTSLVHGNPDAIQAGTVIV